MAPIPPARQDPAPFLARLPAGPIHDSIRLIWDRLQQVLTQLPLGTVLLTIASVDRVRLFAAETIPTATPTTLTWLLDQSVVDGADRQELFNVTATPTRVTLPRRLGNGTATNGQPSLWLVVVNVTWESNVTGFRQVLINFTTPAGVTILANLSEPAVNGTTTGQSAVALLTNPVGGGYLTVEVQQTSGADRVIAASLTVLQLF